MFDPNVSWPEAQIDALSATDGPPVTPSRGTLPTLDARTEQAAALLERRALEAEFARAQPTPRRVQAPVEIEGPALHEDLIAAGLRRPRGRSIALIMLVVLAALVGFGWWSALDSEVERADSVLD